MNGIMKGKIKKAVKAIEKGKFDRKPRHNWEKAFK